MKIILAVPHPGNDVPAWCFLPDSALVNTGKPFFIPDFADRFDVVPAVAFKVSRMGKGIARRFGHRYYTEWAPALHIHAPLLAGSLTAAGLPTDMARSFEKSLTVAPFRPIESLPQMGSLQLLNRGLEVSSLPLEGLTNLADILVEAASRDNIVKMGDILIPATGPGHTLAIGDRLALQLQGETLIDLNIK